ncbi:hypothetical protein AgCh_034119 [Apium graveolens]
MNYIEKSLSTFVLKTVTLGYFGIIVFGNLAAFTMQRLKSLELFCLVRMSSSALWIWFPNFRGEHEQAAEARQQLPRLVLPLNTTGDAKKMVGKTIPNVPPNPGAARKIRKSVSINENVEEIIPNKRRSRKIYGTDNEDVKPLKSILKVGSRFREKQ